MIGVGRSPAAVQARRRPAPRAGTGRVATCSCQRVIGRLRKILEPVNDIATPSHLQAALGTGLSPGRPGKSPAAREPSAVKLYWPDGIETGCQSAGGSAVAPFPRVGRLDQGLPGRPAAVRAVPALQGRPFPALGLHRRTGRPCWTCARAGARPRRATACGQTPPRTRTSPSSTGSSASIPRSSGCSGRIPSSPRTRPRPTPPSPCWAPRNAARTATPSSTPPNSTPCST